MGLSPPLLLSGSRKCGVESLSVPSPLLRDPCSLASCSTRPPEQTADQTVDCSSFPLGQGI
jgi:hypothetical protein